MKARSVLEKFCPSRSWYQLPLGDGTLCVKSLKAQRRTNMGAQWSAVKEAYDRVGVECCRTRDGLKVKDAASTLVSSRCAVRGFVSTPRSVHTASTTPRGIAFTPRDTARSSYSTSSHLSTPRDRDSPRTQMLTQCFECQKRPVTTVYAPARVTRLRPVGRPQVARVPAHAYERRSARALACPCPRCCVRLRRGFRKGLSSDSSRSSRGWSPAATSACVPSAPLR